MAAVTPIVVFTPWGQVVVSSQDELLVLGRLCGGFVSVRALHRLERVGA